MICDGIFPCSARNEDVRLMLWDTAGQEEFDAITKAYYRGMFLNFVFIVDFVVFRRKILSYITVI